MSFEDFSNRDVSNGIDQMYDYNRDGKIDPNEQANINGYYDRMSGGYSSHSSYSWNQIRLTLMVIGAVVFIIACIVKAIGGAVDKGKEAAEERKEEVWENAQTVHYFYEDGTESDPDNREDDKYGIVYDPYYEWEYDD